MYHPTIKTKQNTTRTHRYPWKKANKTQFASIGVGGKTRRCIDNLSSLNVTEVAKQPGRPAIINKNQTHKTHAHLAPTLTLLT